MRTRNSPELSQVLAEAKDIAQNVGHSLSTTHVLLALFTVPNPAELLLREKQVDEDVLLGTLTRLEPEPETVVEDLVQRAHTLARQVGARNADCLHLLVAMLRARDIAAHRLLAQTDLNLVQLRNQAMSYLTGQLPRRLRATRERAAAEQAVPERQRHLSQTSRPSGAPPSVEARRQSPPPSEKNQPPLPLPGSGDGEPRGAREDPDEGARPPPPPKRPPRRSVVPPPAEPSDPVGHYDLDPTEFPWLSSLGRNLTQLAADDRIDPLIGRDREVEEVIDILGKRRTNNPVLVGEPGVGKTAIVEGLATRLLELARGGSSLADKILVELDMASVLAGTHLRGSFSEKLGGIKEEVRKADGRVVVFIDELHTVIGAGATGDGPQDAANELKAALARGEFPCIGATTHDEYRKFIESDPALERRFSPVLVTEPDVDATVAILQGLVGHYAEHHEVEYLDEALEAAANLAARYVSDRFLPDKAIAVIDLAGSRARRAGQRQVGAREIAEVISKTAGVPEERLLMTDRERFLKMEDHLAERIVGHRSIIGRVGDVVRRNYAGFDSHRPMGSFLFLGPTGVGKTELAKALADFLFGSRDALVRCDMSEYGEANTVARLVGAPPGYVGYGDGGQLTEMVRRRPFCVVLLDEIEKAHRDVLQILLQVLDEGHLTDGRGRQVSFTNTLVLLTSNLGSGAAGGSSGGRVGFAAGDREAQQQDAREERVLDIARQSLAPELWNRIDERLVFAPLGRDEVAGIARLLLRESSRILEDEKRIRYEVDDGVIEHLIESGGYDPDFGARPMRRTIQRLIEAPLAEQILSGSLAPGARVRVVHWRDGLRFDQGA